MAVILASALLAASILQPLLAQSADPYADAAVESPPEDSPTETAPVVISSPYAYLYATYPRYARRLDCVYTRESHWIPTAVNPRSGATGLAQFILSTWRDTPQGRSGASRTDPYASIDASVYLIEQTPQGWRHWVTISLC